MSNDIKFELGQQRFVKVSKWRGQKRVGLREWGADKPTKKGISLTLIRWRMFLNVLEYADEALKTIKRINIIWVETYVALLRKITRTWIFDSIGNLKKS